MDDFETPEDGELDGENDDDAASDASYHTEDSEELKSDLKIPHFCEDIDESEIESISESIHQEDDEEVGVNDVDEAGVLQEEAEVDAEESDDEAGIVSDDDSQEPYIDDEDNTSSQPNDDTDSVEESNEDTSTITRPRIRQQVDGNLDGKYWAGTVAANICEYNQMQASLSTPQYGLYKGLKVFGKAAYDAVVKELSENLFDRGAMEMVFNPTY